MPLFENLIERSVREQNGIFSCPSCQARDNISSIFHLILFRNRVVDTWEDGKQDLVISRPLKYCSAFESYR